jgi:hypothetical protein
VDLHLKGRFPEGRAAEGRGAGNRLLADGAGEQTIFETAQLLRPTLSCEPPGQTGAGVVGHYSVHLVADAFG